MEKFKHCSLCDNHIMDMQTGIKCGLTKEKPSFEHKCDKVIFQDKAFHDIEEVNFHYKFIQRKKAKIYFNLVVFSGIAGFFVLSGLVGGVLLFENGVISTGPLIMIGIGLAILPIPMRPWFNYLQEVGGTKDKKKQIDNLLKIYGMEAIINFDIKEGKHEIFDVKTNISLQQHGKEMKSYTNDFEYTSGTSHLGNSSFDSNTKIFDD